MSTILQKYYLTETVFDCRNERGPRLSQRKGPRVETRRAASPTAAARAIALEAGKADGLDPAASRPPTETRHAASLPIMFAVPRNLSCFGVKSRIVGRFPFLLCIGSSCRL